MRRDTVIRTARCLIRPPRQADYTRWARLRSTSRAYLEPWEPRWPSDALSMEDWKRRMRAWREGWDSDRFYVFFIFDTGLADLVGGVSLSHVRRGPAQAASLGYWMGEAHAGHGLMRDAVHALCNWAWSVLDLERIEAATVPENTRSQRVLSACGFVREGFAREFLEIAGIRRDHVLYARLREGPADGDGQ